MELLLELREHNQSEEPCEEGTPNKEKEENFDISDYDYNKRLWF
ncbi:hypothetical protein [Bacillus sp. MUM 116]|nr:hypothetical protein [Bacillus sp. MUM 116]